jgi:endonuclease III
MLMPIDPQFQQLDMRTMEAYRRLTAKYGEVPLVPRREPMHELISTMLSHRTTQKNEALAYQAMIDRFGSWEAIQNAAMEELATAIAQAQFPGAKAANIKKTLERIYEERGEYSINFLNDLSTEEGLAWLTSLPGVGIKTASLVLLFCFAKPVLPVDTHVHRVSARVGLIPEKASAEAAHTLLPALLPEDSYVYFNFHIALLKHGQQVCIWSNPRCHLCPLPDICEWYQKNRAGKDGNPKT